MNQVKGVYGGNVVVDGPDVLVTFPTGTTSRQTIAKTDLLNEAYGEGSGSLNGFHFILAGRSFQIMRGENTLVLDVDELRSVLL